MNKEQWKQMRFSKKLEWLVQYYGLTVFFSILAVIVVVSLAITFFGPKDRGDIRVIILDDGVSSELCTVFREEINREINGEAEMVSYAKSDPTHMQAFSVRLLSDDLDIVIAPETEMLEMAGNGYLIPYEQNSITDFYRNFPEENLLKIKNPVGNAEVIVGVKLDSESRYMKYRRAYGALENEAMYLGITIKKINDNNIKKTALYLLEQ